MRHPYLSRICAAGLVLAGCTPSPSSAPSSDPPPLNWVRDTINERVGLLQSPPADSVIVVRAGYTILLSMHDIEAYLSEWVPSPDLDQFRDLLRQRFAESGHATLGDGFLETLVAANLVERGKAAIRADRGRMIPFVELAMERHPSGTYVVSDRLIFTPTGTLLLRVRHSVTIS